MVCEPMIIRFVHIYNHQIINLIKLCFKIEFLHFHTLQLQRGIRIFNVNKSEFRETEGQTNT